MNKTNQVLEYFKLFGVLCFITAVAAIITDWRGWNTLLFVESFVGVFFVVFASFKFYRLKEFAYSFQSYEIMKNRSIGWGYAYPFVQLLFGGLYLFRFGALWLDLAVFIWSGYGTYVVWLTLHKKGDFYCLCLGNVIKLPLSTTSFIEDLGMVLLASAMIILR